MEMILIFGVLLLLFGATRLPALGSSLGSAIRNFKKGFNETEGGSEDERKRQNLSSGGDVKKSDDVKKDKVASRDD